MANTDNSAEPVNLWKMRHIETIEEFYQRKFGGVPPDIRKEIGHFNVFKVDPFTVVTVKPVPYSRRDYFKIMLVKGNYKIHYADQGVEIKNQALVFSNPHIPYSCEFSKERIDGFFCLFTPGFFHQYGSLNQYSVFHPGGNHIFSLTDEQVSNVSKIFQRMFSEISSDYIHKYDVLRNLVFELLHLAMKMEPGKKLDQQPVNAGQRISTLFMELLERQFPIDENHKEIQLRSASDYARQLNVHVNHLNKAIKENSGRTTTQIIAERLLQEAKILLKHSPWTVSEIAYALGFKEVTHFNNFFKKHQQLSPLKYRAV